MGCDAVEAGAVCARVMHARALLWGGKWRMLGRGRREASYADSRRPGFVDLPLAGKRETREIVYRRRQARVFVGPKFDVRRRRHRRCCRYRRR